MNGLFISQSGSLEMFYGLSQAMNGSLHLNKMGLLVSHRRNFSDFQKANPDNLLKKYTLFKEWEVTNNFKSETLDYNLLNDYEKQLGVSTLWEALIADRRLTLGRKTSYFQDYNPRYSHEDLLKILQTGLQHTEQLFDAIKPDFVVSFICVTMLEYLCYLFAQSRNIPFLNIRTARLENYMVYGNNVTDPSERIVNKYHDLSRNSISPQLLEQSTDIYKKIKSGSGKYEGLTIQNPNVYKKWTFFLKNFNIVKIVKIMVTEYQIKFGKYKDNHDPGIIIPTIFERIYKPLLKKSINLKLKKQYVPTSDLNKYTYAFFPLHLEPERVLLISARYYLNQIEVVRNIAQSLPAGMTLIVKDHPKGFGRRPYSFYDKLLKIPNVKLIRPDVNSEVIIENAKLITTIAGTVGWEAIIKEKPVIIFGPTIYDFLPSSMVRKITDINKTSQIIQELLETYKFNEASIIQMIASSVSESIPINFYSTLLSRKNVVNIDSIQDDWDQEIRRLAKYTIKSLQV